VQSSARAKIAGLSVRDRDYRAMAIVSDGVANAFQPLNIESRPAS